MGRRRRDLCTLAVLLALPPLACGGRETAPPDAGARPDVRLRGCVERGEAPGGFILRLDDGGAVDQPGGAGNPSASADANGGQTAALGRSQGRAVGTSTTAANPWPGTRAYRLVPPDGVDLARLTGSRVEGRGGLSRPPSAVKSGATDQQQAHGGEPFEALRATAIDVLAGRCPSGSPGETDLAH